jgi:hypothetical protein
MKDTITNLIQEPVPDVVDVTEVKTIETANSAPEACGCRPLVLSWRHHMANNRDMMRLRPSEARRLRTLGDAMVSPLVDKGFFRQHRAGHARIDAGNRGIVIAAHPRS